MSETKALVSRGQFSKGGWKIEDVKLRELHDDEVLVEIVASGICATDLHWGDSAADAGIPGVSYPRVLGHEGKSSTGVYMILSCTSQRTQGVFS